MRISMWMLADWLRDYRPSASIARSAFSIESARLFSGELPAGDSTVYIGRLRDLFSTDSGQVICTHKNDMLLLRTDGLEEVFNRVLNALEFYQGWATRMLELLAANAGLQALFDATRDVLPEPVFLMDASQRFLAHMRLFGRGEIDRVWDEMVAFGSPDIDFLVKVNQAYPERFVKRELYVLEAGPFPQRCYNRNFFFQDKWIGTVVQIERDPPVSQGRLDVFVLFSGFLQRWFDTHIQEEQTVILDSLLLAAVTDREAPGDELIRRLELLGWRQKDPLLLLKLDTPFPSFATSQHLCRTMNLQFDFQYAFHAEPSVCVLANLRLCPLAELPGRLQPWLRSSRCYGMQSRPFTMRDSFYEPYQYISMTSAYCEKRPGRLYAGERYALPYILRQLRGTLLPEAAHPALAMLRSYDETHHTELCQTLHVYLKHERSLVRTAEALQLHRNSLLYRIKRLEELLDADLEDPAVRLHLLLSFEIAP